MPLLNRLSGGYIWEATFPMPRPFLETDFACWAPDGQPFRIEFAVPVLEEISALAVEGLSRFRHGGMEVGGVLFGEAESDRVRIWAFRPLECEYAFGPRFVLSERDRSSLRDLLYAPRHEPELGGLEAVGWYHSHTRSEIALSPRDLEVYDSYFPLRWQVALVMRPEDYGPVRAGFFFREADAVVRTDSSYAEFSVLPRYHGLVSPPAGEEDGAAAEPAEAAAEAEPEQPEPEPERPGAQPASASETAPLEAAPIEVPRFAQAQAQPRPARPGLWLLLALAAAGACGFGFQRYYSLGAPPQPLSLWVADVGGQLLIEWDRSAEAIRDASGGMLEIQDGTDRVENEIAGDRLREGSVDYVRSSEIVDVRLRVRARGSSAEESIRFIGPPVRRKPSAEGDLARQRDELKAQVEALQKQMQGRDAQIGRLRAQLKAAQARQP